MNRTYWTAIILILVTGLISVALHVSGFPPVWEQQERPAAVSAIQQLIAMPFGLAGISALMTLPIALSKKERLSAPGKVRAMAVAGTLMVPVCLLGIQILLPLTQYDVVSDGASHIAILALMVGFFLVMGNYIAAAPYGSRMGFRTKATLSDETVWAKTHRFLGRNLVMVTLISAPAGLMLVENPKHAQWVLFGAVICTKLATYVYARQIAMHQLTARKIHSSAPETEPAH